MNVRKLKMNLDELHPSCEVEFHHGRLVLAKNDGDDPEYRVVLRMYNSGNPLCLKYNNDGSCDTWRYQNDIFSGEKWILTNF